MSDDRGPVVSLRLVREATIARLSTAFAADDLDLDEFERRVTLAHRAESVAGLEGLVTDLPAPTVGLAPVSTSLVVVPTGPERRTLAAIMGATERAGPWVVPRQLRTFTLMGGMDLDFREAQLMPGENHVRIFCAMGGVDIIVPPEVVVDMDGVAILGAFEHLDRVPAQRDPTAPYLRVTGVVLMGAVSIQTRLLGESARDARRRKKIAAKALRKSAEFRR